MDINKLARISAVTIVQDLPVLYTPVGQSAVMSCEMREAENLQIIHYHWYLNYTHPDRILKNSTRVTIMSNTLIISSVTTDDNGIYICTARGYKLQTYQGTGTHLQVQGISAMTIVQDPPVLYTPVGESAVMSCEMREAENLQILHYHWYLYNTHPDHLLRNSTRVTILSNTLIISSVTTDDTGIYICTAQDSNLHIYQGTGTHLLVRGASAVTIVQDPPVLYTPVGESAVMSCEMREAENLQIRHYHWYLNCTLPDHILKNSPRVNIMSNTLIISSVTTDDTGIYICTTQDSNLHVYQGTGTHLLVQGSDHHSGKYLYYLIVLIVPLLLLPLVCWKCIAKKGTPTSSGERRDKKRRQQKGNDTDLHYSTIIPQPKVVQKKKTRKQEGVEYSTIIPQPKGAQMKKTRKEEDIEYSTIFPQPKGAQKKKTRKEEEVEYAPVRIATSNPSSTPKTSKTNNTSMEYASLKM